MSKVKDVQAVELMQTIQNARQPVLVEFYASWCAPCKVLAPVVEELATEFDGQIVFLRIDAEEAHDLASQHGVESIPALLLFKHAQVAARKVGVASREFVRALIEQGLREQP